MWVLCYYCEWKEIKKILLHLLAMLDLIKSHLSFMYRMQKAWGEKGVKNFNKREIMEEVVAEEAKKKLNK